MLGETKEQEEERIKRRRAWGAWLLRFRDSFGREPSRQEIKVAKMLVDHLLKKKSRR